MVGCVLHRRWHRTSGVGQAQRRQGQVEVDVSGAVAVIHAVCIAHLDIKPANVLLGGDGHAFLSDFGTVRVEGVDTSTVLYQSTRRNQLAETCFCNVQNDN